MKRTLLICSLVMLFLSAANAQKNKPKPKYVLAQEQAAKMVETIPTKEDKIFYDEVISADSSLKKDQLFIAIRQWFVENFSDSKNVLEVNDKENGLLTGKGTYKYSNINGINAHTGYTKFVINVAVKDGRFRYQLYDFTADNTNTSLLGGKDAVPSHSTVTMNEMLALYKSGKREKYARKFLEDMVELVYFINKSLTDLSKQTTSISDF